MKRVLVVDDKATSRELSAAALRCRRIPVGQARSPTSLRYCQAPSIGGLLDMSISLTSSEHEPDRTRYVCGATVSIPSMVPRAPNFASIFRVTWGLLRTSVSSRIDSRSGGSAAPAVAIDVASNSSATTGRVR